MCENRETSVNLIEGHFNDTPLTGLNFAGHSDWRFPTLEELNNLWDASRPVSSKDGEKIGLPREFKGKGSYYLWTSNERGLDNVWYFGLGHKENYFNLKDLGDLDQGVKLVRTAK